MTRHKDLDITNLHHPMGSAVVGGLQILDDNTNSYLIENAISGDNYFRINSHAVGGLHEMQYGNNGGTAPTIHSFFGGCISFNGSAGTSGQVLTSSGGFSAPTWAAVNNLTGTTSNTFTINTDASAAVQETTALILLSGDGVAAPNNDIEESRFEQSTVGADYVHFWSRRNRNGGGYTERACRLEIGQHGSTAQLAPVLAFNSSTSVPAAQTVSMTWNGVSGTVPTFDFDSNVSPTTFRFLKFVSCPGTGSTQSERYGALAATTGGNNVVIGYNANGSSGDNNVCIGQGASNSGGSNVSIGQGATGGGGVSSNQAIAVGFGSQAIAVRSICMGYQATVASTSDDCVIIGANATSSVAQVANICLGRAATAFGSNQFIVGGNVAGAGITTMVIGKGNTSTTAQGVTLRLTNGSGTNNGAGDLTIIPGIGTGTANSGSFIVQTALPTGSGSSLQTAFERFQINGPEGWIRQNSVNQTDGRVYSLTGYATTTDAATTTTVLTVPLNTTGFTSGGGWLDIYLVAARQTTVQIATFHWRLRFDVQASVATVLTGSPQDWSDVDAGLSTVTTAVNASGNNLLLQVNGVAATTINWSCRAQWQMAQS